MVDTTVDVTPKRSKLTIKDMEDKFREITLHLYDTWIDYDTMAKVCLPYVSDDMVFKDPWQTIVGKKSYWNAAKGFHSSIWFDFDIHQLHVVLNDRGDRGRCLVDGTMNLRQLNVFKYPLRTLLAYDFEVVDGGTHFKMTLQEEMWSFADMIENLPLGIGTVYNWFRYFMGQILFIWLFFLSIVFYSPFFKNRTMRKSKYGKKQ
ncbi:rlmL [Acrasis kona]|uniref:RlmL n=1 Tax=Acrasis kona TaxID=1008807 RepID=A0AAW2YK43_9EUKA